jgi:hypothetical protein
VGPPFSGYGYGQAAEVCILAGRVRFGVADPGRAGQLKLSLTYRGGVVVYLNGTEVARGHMPAGRIEPLTLAEDYATEVFCGPDGAPLPPPPERGQPPAGLAQHYQKRFRALNVDLPARLLCQGTNVLAFEVHRAALPAKLIPGASGADWNPGVGKGVWGACGIENVLLSAPADSGVAANPGVAPDPQIWNCDMLLRVGSDVTSGDPLAPLRPVRMACPRNGVSSAQVVVSSTRELSGISAALNGLTTDSGAALDAGCVQVRYATTGESVPKLFDKPPGPAKMLPIWLTARIPKDTAPGDYRGTLNIAGLDKPALVPVQVTVYAWTLPDLRDYGMSVVLLHCPQSVAWHYKAPLWSDRHFRLLEKSMALMGYAGNTLLSISAIGEDLLGDHPVIVFRKEGDRYVPDLRFARRYLELYDKHAGPPRQLSMQIWNYSISNRGPGSSRDGAAQRFICKTLKVRLLDGDKLVPAEMPVYTQPGTEETWAAVAAGIKQIVRDLGWNRTRLLWGTGGDNLPNEEIVAFFKKIAPDVYWRVATHGGSVSRWGKTPEERTQRNGMVLGYGNLVRSNHTRRPLLEDCPFDVLKRDAGPRSPPDFLETLPLGRIAAGYSGVGFLNFDGWPCIDVDGKARGPIRTYVRFGNIGPSGGTFVAPGPDGAMPSPQLEAMREGLQITEAILQLRAALADPQRSAAVKPGMAAEAKTVIQSLMDVMESTRRVRPCGAAEPWPLVRRIYQLISEVAPGPVHYDVRTQK